MFFVSTESAAEMEENKENYNRVGDDVAAVVVVYFYDHFYISNWICLYLPPIYGGFVVK